MTHPDVKFGPITHMKQSLEASCVPTSVSMILSGYGINVSEGDLIERYFSTATLKASDINAGVSNEKLIKGLVQILSDEGVANRLQVGVFLPHYWEYTSSSADRFITYSDPSAAAREKRGWRKAKHAKQLESFNGTLEELAKNHTVGLYSANKRLVKAEVMGGRYRPDNRDRFYDEFANWLSEGHSIGVHGGLTLHVWAVDGSRSTREAIHVIDPRGESWESSVHSLVRTDSHFGIRADWFDLVVRLSEKKQEPERGFDRNRAWQDFKNRISFRG